MISIRIMRWEFAFDGNANGESTYVWQWGPFKIIRWDVMGWSRV